MNWLAFLTPWCYVNEKEEEKEKEQPKKLLPSEDLRTLKSVSFMLDVKWSHV